MIEQDKYVSAAKFAELNGIKRKTLYERLCRHGHYFGVAPIKRANGRLLFPATQVLAEQGGDE